jgi:hypothetical protein
MMTHAIPGTAHIAFLHTARPNIELFGGLMARIAPTVPTRHELLETVLQSAVGTGTVTDTMRQETEGALRALADSGAALVVCTCSTIGGIAEATTLDDGSRVMRIDRPMAEAAVASGRRIRVAATLPSTLRPTVALIEQVATEMHRSVTIVEQLCVDAWPHFQRGDHAAYAKAIADAVTAAAGPDDVVVLAQASMAPAEPLINASGLRALSSPELGVREAVQAYRRAIA